MKKIIYLLIKFWIKTSLHLYYAKINISGLENIPTDKPVMFLPNHQNALLDPLLIAVDCNRKPYFLTRSDVFKSTILNRLFALVRMIPIYRIRDGRDSLRNNAAVFEKCAELLERGESLLMFPEANHNLQRRVRPLSKGFTRILFETWQQNPDLDIQIVPVGLNYVDAENFPDKVAIYYGETILAQKLYDPKDLRTSVDRLKHVVSERLKTLTVHIDSGDSYDRTVQKLDLLGVDYLDPKRTNAILAKIDQFESPPFKKTNNNTVRLIFGRLFYLFNLPMILLWRCFVKPKVWEPEFTATFRFMICLLLFPIFYALLFVVLQNTMGQEIAWIVPLAHMVFNLVYIKLK